MERRRLLNAGAGLAVTAWAAPFTTAEAAPNPTSAPASLPEPASEPAPGSAAGAAGRCSGPQTTPYGVASYTAAIVGATVLGDYAYVVARGQNPPLVGQIDLRTRRLVRTVRLDRGDGGWATTVSGGHVYIGTYPYSDLYRLDPATGATTRIGTLGPTGSFVWCLTTAPDGAVYAGTYPRGEVWEYRPDTGVLRNLGRAMAGEQYVRGIAADETYVYGATLPHGHVVAYDRATGARLGTLTPEPYGGASALLAHDGRVIGSLGRTVVDLAQDGSDPHVLPIPAAERLVDAMATTPDGTLYCVGRPTGTVYRRDGDRLVPVATPASGDEHRALLPLPGGAGGTLLGAAGSGRLWWLDLATGAADLLELIDIGLSGPDPVQSIARDAHPIGAAVHVGGHYSLTTHDPERGTARRIRIPGEPKAMRVVDGLVYAAMYPSTEVLEIEPRFGRIRSLGFVLHDQQRPTDLAHAPDDNLLLLASAPPAGGLAGALTLVDRRARTLTVHRGVIPDQSVMSVALDDRRGHRIAYLAGDTWGGGSVPPARPSATVAAFDLRSRRVLWEHAPIEGYASLQHIEVLGGVLYGVYKRAAGVWFAMDLDTKQILATGQLPSYGELSVHFGHVFAAVFGGAVYRIGPGLTEAEQAAGGLGNGWYNPPQLAWERTSWHAWGMSSRDLARLRLDPSCPMVDQSPVKKPVEAILKALLAN
ncbi:PQQ-like beta-propeller repeat protein [Streptomyces sp. TRM64462]|uniref:PQQ-like beta-propeller repeat protein n=1 Tax=Streptomyces sp. TRM64462 TaxID=2741726 RepID=UPI0015863871|nr:PQQ-like beta-propeller repeat protein [Streptomyces sp. TRM64462]